MFCDAKKNACSSWVSTVVYNYFSFKFVPVVVLCCAKQLPILRES